ncbi:PFS domain-containing protein [Colletotrichum truncatum]|uniref:PFS domain-containing protein n=1 Tax=Colletotrichum truncatum TaxID=5467 RepID=A0ACC3YWE2_COLTU|nr:PFS domain-containing protein [Colletotrichum truncatum]KAF6781211.1 PFS domain-containing protein [Colletotrichum truncatum]
MASGHDGPEAYRNRSDHGELSDYDSRSNEPKRRRIWQEDEDIVRNQEQKGSPARLQHVEYTVGWICALPIELAVSEAMLDQVHESLPTKDNDDNVYTLGSIGKHNIVMACLPFGQYGTNNAAIVASNMHRSFPSIRIRLMVGIGGGVPGDLDIRLGDIVVGTKVIQYDMGKIVSGGRIQRTGTLRVPPPLLLKAIAQLQARHERTVSNVPSILNAMVGRYPQLAKCAFPSLLDDRLFWSTYEHNQQSDCSQCDYSKLHNRPARPNHDPKVHYGGIASGNQVVKSGRDRDRLAEELDIICFEMEAAGLMDVFPCLVIRGICDYADSHKNKQWQPYAAATAAAFVKELLSIFTPNPIIESEVTVQSRRTQRTQVPTAKNDERMRQIRRTELMKLIRFHYIDSRHATIKSAQRKTCEWILEHPFYKDWLDPAKASYHHGFLWISGKPGAGKSTLMKFAFGNISKSPDTSTAHTSFFFNARGDELEKSTEGLYRSLLFQLLEHFPDLQSVFDDTNLVPLKLAVCPTVEVLRKLFENAVMCLDQRRLICFVDALDECDEEQVREMVEYLEGLAEDATTIGVRLQICFSSRHYPHLDIKHGLKLTLEYQIGHGKDLEKYVRDRLQVGQRSDAEEIKIGVLEKANGVFMWVVLVVDILNKEYRRGRISAAKKKLGEIPGQLGELFKDILRRDKENMDDLLLCIQCILYAKRPLLPTEFYFAMLSGPKEDLVIYDSDKITVEDLDLCVVSSSKGLAEITKSDDGTVQFIHESVRDFLVKDKGLQELWPHLGQGFGNQSHDTLKQCCLSYIQFAISSELHTSRVLPEVNSEEAKLLQQNTSERFPFIRYAIRNVLHHADFAAEITSQQPFLEQFPLQDWIYLTNLFEDRKILHYPPNLDITYLLAERGLNKLLELHLQHHPHTHVRGGQHEFALFAALANEHNSSAKLILGQSDHESEYDLDEILSRINLSSYRKGEGLLHWAIEEKHAAIAGILINSKTFDWTTKGSFGRTALHSAALVGDVATATLLLHKVDEAYQQGSKASTRRASQASSLQSLNICIDKSTYINLENSKHSTPLSFAAENGHEDFVRMLLELGANLESHPGHRSPLSLASGNGFDPIVRRLLEHGADVNSKDSKNQTPLSFAAANGHHNVVHTLCQYEATINTQDLYSQTPLFLAATNGHKAVVQALCELEASVNITDDYGRTPLMFAAANGFEGIVEVICDNGGSVDAKEEHGRTALLLAAAKGHTGVVAFLHKNGGSINVEDSFGRTPLWYAANNKRESTFSFLQLNGASCGNPRTRT